MRSTLLVLLLAGAGSALADPINDRVMTSFGGNANVINLFTNGGNSFGTANNFTEPNWVVSVLTPTHIQLVAGGGTPDVIQWLQDFVAAGSNTSMNFAWQSTIWDYGTNSPGAIAFGGRTASTGSIFTINMGPNAAANYTSAGGPGIPGVTFVAPVPEPSTMLIGAMGLGVLAWRRRMRGATPPAEAAAV